MAQPFDAERIQLTGEPVPIAEGLQFNPANRSGSFCRFREWRASLPRRRWTRHRARWCGSARNGAEQALAAPARLYGQPRLSPDGRRVAVEVGHVKSGFTIWSGRR